MARSTTGAVLPHLFQALQRQADSHRRDGELLDRFLLGDEEAFAALVQRHGPVVLGVCQRLLADAHEAEDAFQATFLVLARKAGSIRKQSSVGSWLYGVAYRIAQKAKARAARRRASQPSRRGVTAMFSATVMCGNSA